MDTPTSEHRTEHPAQQPAGKWARGLLGAASTAAIGLWLAAIGAAFATWYRPHEFLVEGLAALAGAATLAAVVIAVGAEVIEALSRERQVIVDRIAEYQDAVAAFHVHIAEQTVELHANIQDMIAANARAAQQAHDDAEAIKQGLDQWWSGYRVAVHDLAGIGNVIEMPRRPGA